MSARLTTLVGLPAHVLTPRYRPDDHGAGIVQLGLGAFHKAHQAVYTDDALAAAGGDWRIIGVSLRSTTPSKELTPQNCLYTTLERSSEGTRPRVIGALAEALCLKTDRQAVLDALTAPATKIVSLTVTEKGYGIDRSTGGADPSHPAIAADLASPGQPQGVAGLLVWAIDQRRKAGLAPFTVMSCDNLPDNGALTRGLLLDFAKRTNPVLVPYIAEKVAFPATMVDRITPARGPETLGLASELIGCDDAGAVECEAFRQWVVEDHFPSGRPDWQAGGALFVRDVRPYETMKLRMLNGAHSMLAYAGFLSGHRYVRDVMQDRDLSRLVRRHLQAAADTLAPLQGVDFAHYARDLAARFENPHLAHETYQIAMDGSEKMPQRIFAPTFDALAAGQAIEPFAFAVAAWMRYTLGFSEDGTPYELRDPMASLLSAGGDPSPSAQALVAHLCGIKGLIPAGLVQNPHWCEAVTASLDQMLSVGMQATIAEAARRA